jgi:drug/metabolite transporter (DMT)-like permease
VKKSGSVFASLVGYVITLAGVFWGMLFFGESHSIWVWAALVTMLVGMAMVTPREQPVV